MTDIEEAVRRLRGLKERVDRLEGQREGEGEINIFRLVSDRSITADSVDAKLNDIGVSDRSNTSDIINARENDIDVTDRSNTGDTINARENDIDESDRSQTSDTVNARENDKDVTDRSNTTDAVATTTGEPADFVWADHSTGTGDKWGFFEYRNH